jgi:hypothetical protein
MCTHEYMWCLSLIVLDWPKMCFKLFQEENLAYVARRHLWCLCLHISCKIRNQKESLEMMLNEALTMTLTAAISG